MVSVSLKHIRWADNPQSIIAGSIKRIDQGAILRRRIGYLPQRRALLPKGYSFFPLRNSLAKTI